LYTITNKQNNSVSITNYGGIITSIQIKDNKGVSGNVVLGFDNMDDYKTKSRYFGCLVGRFCNRIAQGKFTLDDKEYTLAVNNGPNHLHGGIVGFDKKIWQVVEELPDGLKLSCVSADGEEGYPGNVTVTVTYTFNDENELKIDYIAETDQATVINLTNHSYFNLSADPANQTILDHELVLNADKYTVVDSTSIPTGELRDVVNTVMDFNSPHTIGERIQQIAPGYDHNYVLNNPNGELTLAATVTESTSGRVMQVFTTQPGVQLYTGNFLDASANGFGMYGALCLETQHFPDSPNHSHFPSTVLRPNEKLKETTIYKFSLLQ
jgi:aldose 1-epimerase